jgi:cob(I)alamin adenosyltransferase
MTMASSTSRILINTGQGKGKSSAAFGVMARAWARGWKVIVIQFIKGGKWKVGEKKLADHLGIEFYTLGDGFTWESKDISQTQQLAQNAWDFVKKILTQDDYDLVILDEFTYPINYGWLDVKDVVSTINQRNPKINLVITGRNACQELIEIADTVTEMKKIKHAYDLGIRAKKGIEY